LYINLARLSQQGRMDRMSQIESTIGLSSGANAWMVARRMTPKLPSLRGLGLETTSDYTLPESAISRSDLLALNAGVDDSTRKANSLTTANDAIGVIGGMLQNIQTVLVVSGPGNSVAIDPATEQGRIDSAISTIDAIASTAQFGGQNLLQGNFSVTGTGSSLSLPSFLSAQLGVASKNNANVSTTAPLASLLASANLATAGQIVASALSQVAATQIQITGYLSGAADLAPTTVRLPNANVPGNSKTADVMFTTAAQMLNEPSLAALAAANSSGQNVLELLWP
jgi:flagellin-like hook-associated protein FlgL